MLVDSHCHLDLLDSPSDTLARARENGVETILNISIRLPDFPRVRQIAEEHKQVFCTVGLHPHHAHEGTTVETLVAEASHPKVVGLGETGLDYHYENSPKESQKINFRMHAQAARETGLPLVVHTRDADQDTIDFLREEKPLTGVLHCFTGSEKLARAALDLGFYISFSGILTFKNAGDLREIAKTIPLERLLVETDAPYLAPVPHRGKPNEPAFMPYTARCLADLQGVSFESLAAQTTKNFFTLFWRAQVL